MNFAVDLGSVHEQARLMDRSDWEAVWLEAADGRPVSVPLPAMPPQDIQVITNGKFGSPTMAGAAKLLRIVDEEVAARVSPDTGYLRLLDYGAGWGRITRLFLRSFAPQNIRAVDVAERLVASGEELLPGLDFQLIDSGGKLPYPDDAFDVVVANSVFSHLSEGLQIRTLSELSRVTKPDGLLLLTILNSGHYARWQRSVGPRKWIEGVLGEESAVQARLAKGELVFGATTKWPDYGIAVMSEDWPAANWGRANLEVLGSRDDYHQQVQLARPTRLQPPQSDKRGE